MASGQAAHFGETGRFKEFATRELPCGARFLFEPKLLIQCLIHAHSLGRFLDIHEFNEIRDKALVELVREADWRALNADVEDIRDYSEYRAWQHRVDNEKDMGKEYLSQDRN